MVVSSCKCSEKVWPNESMSFGKGIDVKVTSTWEHCDGGYVCTWVVMDCAYTFELSPFNIWVHLSISCCEELVYLIHGF